MYKILIVTIIYLTAFGIGNVLPLTSESPPENIVDGKRTTIEKVPWQVALLELFTEGPFCGGSIISEFWVLTGAHCLCLERGFGTKNINFDVRSGHKNFNKGFVHQVDRIVCHKNYTELIMSMSGIITHAPINDIALIRVQNKFVFGSKQNLVSLNTSPVKNLFGINTTVSGWGATTEDAKIFAVSLREATMRIISRIRCRQLLKKFGITRPLLNAEICMQTIGMGTSCFSDSGGPVVVNGTQIGIISWGPSDSIDSCNSEAPLICTNIAYFKDWILMNGSESSYDRKMISKGTS